MCCCKGRLNWGRVHRRGRGWWHRKMGVGVALSSPAVWSFVSIAWLSRLMAEDLKDISNILSAQTIHELGWEWGVLPAGILESREGCCH